MACKSLRKFNNARALVAVVMTLEETKISMITFQSIEHEK